MCGGRAALCKKCCLCSEMSYCVIAVLCCKFNRKLAVHEHMESNQEPAIHLQDVDAILNFSHFLSQVTEILSRQ